MTCTSVIDAAFSELDELIVPLAPTIATSSGPRIRRSDNLRGRLLAILVELMRVFPRPGASFMHPYRVKQASRTELVMRKTT